MKRLDFVWIDDKKDKVEAYRAVIEGGVGSRTAKIELLEIKLGALDFLAKWADERKKRPPSLIIIDHVYDLALPFGLNGSSVAHLLRRAFPLVPIVCVTAMFNRPRKFDQEELSEYTKIFLYQALEHHIDDLFVIAKDFPKLHSGDEAARQHLVSCFKPPKGDREHLLRVLPEEFKDDKHATTEHRAARWTLSVLLDRAGFLYDQLHAATLLGLTENGFTKVSPLFRKARYRGVFASDAAPRWWVSMLRDTLFEVVGSEAPDVPQYAGRLLPGVTPQDHSVCYVSKKAVPPPDAVVAADVTSPNTLRVVRREYSDSHPDDSGLTPGFETRLILKKTAREGVSRT